jgi:uncharacterized protein (DUF488 family)
MSADSRRPTEQVLWTIGHSNHGLEELLDLLGRNGIEVLADVRSAPYSRYAEHFNHAPLERAVKQAGLRYVFLGRELGGRPKGAPFYDAEGHVRYDVTAQAPFFLRGLDRLRTGANRYRVAMMCAEEDPAHCHRRLLVGCVLADEGYELRHIRGDGRVEVEFEVVLHPDLQLSLLDERPPWRSTRSVSPRSPQESSSTP